MLGTSGRTTSRSITAIHSCSEKLADEARLLFAASRVSAATSMSWRYVVGRHVSLQIYILLNQFAFSILPHRLLVPNIVTGSYQYLRGSIAEAKRGLRSQAQPPFIDSILATL